MWDIFLTKTMQCAYSTDFHLIVPANNNMVLQKNKRENVKYLLDKSCAQKVIKSTYPN